MPRPKPKPEAERVYITLWLPAAALAEIDARARELATRRDQALSQAGPEILRLIRSRDPRVSQKRPASRSSLLRIALRRLLALPTEEIEALLAQLP